MWTDEFRAFVAPARQRSQAWRLAIGILIVAAVYFAVLLLLIVGIDAAAGDALPEDWLRRIAQTDTPAAVVAMLATFAGMMAGTIAAAALLHGRGPASLLGSGAARGFGAGAALSGLVFAAMMLLPSSFEVVPNTPADLFMTYLPFALLGLLLQTGAEEVLFRGYLQQQLAARWRHPAVWLVLPSLAFGALHYDPATTGPNAPWIVAAATLFGCVAADLTRVTGSIGVAWGVHFVNNALAVLIVSMDGALSGLSLWKTPFGAADAEILRPLIVQDMLTTVIVWAIIRLWIAHRRSDAPGPA